MIHQHIIISLYIIGIDLVFLEMYTILPLTEYETATTAGSRFKPQNNKKTKQPNQP